MVVALELELLGDVPLKRTLADYGRRADDWRPLWNTLADLLVDGVAEEFATQGARAAGGWADLSPAYAKWKARAAPGAPILVLSGAMRDSLTRRPLGVEVIEPTFMRLGSGVRSDAGFAYPEAHQQGTDRMPRRRPVVLTRRDRVEWVRAAQRFLYEGVGK